MSERMKQTVGWYAAIISSFLAIIGFLGYRTYKDFTPNTPETTSLKPKPVVDAPAKENGEDQVLVDDQPFFEYYLPEPTPNGCNLFMGTSSHSFCVDDVSLHWAVVD